MNVVKLVGTRPSQISLYAIDYCSVLHFIAGIFGYIIIFGVAKLILPEFPSCLIGIIGLLLGSIFWELIENSVLIPIKYDKVKDDVINSQMDTFCVFLGGLAGVFIYNLSLTMMVIIISCHFGIFLLLKFLTDRNSLHKQNTSKTSLKK